MAKRRLEMRRKRPPSALRAPRADHLTERAPTVKRVSPKPYLYVDDLAALVPWTAEAIRTKVRRGEFQRDAHYFQEGHRARLIFKWDAIVAFIERTPPAADVAAPDGHRWAVLDIEQATAALRCLLQEPPK
jgi:hypothetical protein